MESVIGISVREDSRAARAAVDGSQGLDAEQYIF